MKLTLVRFDRVFDIQYRAFGFGTQTEFGFESDGSATYGASVIGCQTIPIGEPLIVAMRREGDWKNLYGWKNLATGSLTIENGRNNLVWFSVIGTVAIALLAPIILLHDPLMTDGERTAFYLCAIGIAARTYTGIARQWRLVKAKRLLRQAPSAA